MKNSIVALIVALEAHLASTNPLAIRSNQICGKAGYDAGTESFWSSSDGSYSACSAACAQQKQCQSFAYGQGECQLYNVAASSNFVSVDGSPYLFYDSGCGTTTDQNVCGRQGYMSGSSAFHGYQTSYDKPTQEALSSCYQLCLTNTESTCEAWQWAPNACQLFSFPTKDHFQAQSDSPYYIWDVSCGKPVAAGSTSSTKATSSSTAKTSAKTTTTSTKKSTTTTTTTTTAKTSTKATTTTTKTTTTTTSTKKLPSNTTSR